LLEELHPSLPRTFELQHLDSPAISNRLFVLALSPAFERLVDLVLPIAPSGLRNELFNYKVIAAVWRGYRSAPPHAR
jgi:hypothetical protein